MIKSIDDLLAIKNEILPTLHLRNPKPEYTFIFPYNNMLMELGIDKEIDYAIDLLAKRKILNAVVIKRYQEDATTITLTLQHDNKTVNYNVPSITILEAIILSHIEKGITFDKYLLNSEGSL